MRVAIGVGLTVAVVGVGTTLGGSGAGTLGDARRWCSTLGDDRRSCVSFGGSVFDFAGSVAGGMRSGKSGGSGSADFQWEKISLACCIAWSWF